MSSRPHPSTLTDEQVQALIKKYQQDEDSQAQDQLIDHFRELVETLAFKFAHGSEPYEDLVQVGMIGLIASLKRFDLSLGRSFESFAVPTIIGEIKRHIRDKTWSVHVPRRIKELGPRIKTAVEELTTKLQRSPKVEEIAEYLGVTEEEVLETMEMGRSYHAVSVDSPIEAGSDGGQVTLLDLVGTNDAGFDQIDRKLLLEKVFSVLTEREQEILKLTFFENLSQKQAGDKLGISQMHVSRLQRRALQKLRQAIRMEPSEVI
ncbi:MULTISPECIES: RNA polymerase sigma factor SigB [unclassified Thermoactinomyces]|jgi:RNA polymerase sigma-B factor|uniref:RNA polymerase sigma factor SigB n=1 Tax=unclassified Thermoactinomyces TaxID=2634588 RepID=UPI0018DD8009|nr:MULTISPECIES: RNA polymerase sigma factor SigB [unclassified Thermoactinomyces]MBH8599529.1 RNA polymerase sigma factor SigB [Thermoactinomyces sp. CICC 10523]MBH8605448.1 RNA polymerase sigma factor SigB [Thermoactinomyces sp. CICC 10522]